MIMILNIIGVLIFINIYPFCCAYNEYHYYYNTFWGEYKKAWIHQLKFIIIIVLIFLSIGLIIH